MMSGASENHVRPGCIHGPVPTHIVAHCEQNELTEQPKPGAVPVCAQSSAPTLSDSLRKKRWTSSRTSHLPSGPPSLVMLSSTPPTCGICDIYDKAAVLCWRLARNHPLPDGNERDAWAKPWQQC